MKPRPPELSKTSAPRAVPLAQTDSGSVRAFESALWSLAAAVAVTLAMAAAGTLASGCGRNETTMDPLPEAGVDASPIDAGVDASKVDAQQPVDAGGCVENTLRCRSGHVEVCDGGSFVTQEDCEFGCVSEPSPHCGSPVFSNEVALEDVEAGVNDFAPGAGDTLIDTDTGTITGPGAPPVGSYPYRLISRDSLGLPPLLVLSFEEVDIGEDTRVVVVGERPLALVAWERITVDGVVELDAAPDGTPGPGGFPGGVDGAAGMGPGKGLQGETGLLDSKEGGGGGGGFGALGGTGGAGGAAVGGNGGSPYGNPQMDPVIGGSGGGSGGKGNASTPGSGGAGGGALMLVSLDRIRVGTTGILSAGGSGGEGGAPQEAGGGGGSGGAFVLAAPRVDVLGVVAANGGGGGGAETATREDGENGHPSATPAAGGTNGGEGGAGTFPTGESAPGTTSHGGGGGGSVGRIRIESRDAPNLSGVVSPDETTPAVSLGTLTVE